MLQLSSGPRKVIQSGTISYTFGAAGVVAVNVAISGVTDLSRVVERLLGYTCNANDYYDVAIELVSTTQLVAHIRANSACTIQVDWDIVASDGRVQRGYVSMSSAGSANATINAVNTSRAKVQNNGLYMVSASTTAGGYKSNSRVKLLDSTTVQIARSVTNTAHTANYHYAVEAGALAA